ncbi:response to light stimulus [Cryphonectria parasitica EP155]|uniref:COP9 signalosome complex subunit 4 n=1 Tax=Cryphonectria parasitica (strain ATCC 38755 / EP155) TaxID=660469 RepID=A0A9P4Y9A1_CRYP1|nr:response to light stimulus [Cryphonectria parasitica EP155]KAF3769329.1 response to light stimulus [Cryphonectria parasitica EP155]
MASQQGSDETQALQNALSQASSAQEFNTIADQILDSSKGIVVTRPLLTSFINALRSREDYNLWVEVGAHTIDILTASPTASSSYLEQAALLRELIADGHEANEDYGAAARVLAEIPLESSQRRVSTENKCQIWIRIVRLYLEEDDPTLAETYLNKLKAIIHKVADPETQLHFRLSAARINDSKRQFLSASQAYHEISFLPAVAEDDRLRTLGEAIKCAILAPAGPSRSRALGRLYKDERAAGLEEFGILEKMFLDRLIDPAEVDKFAQSLQAHQLATTADGSTVLARAMVEHNLLAVSRLYVNIDLEALGVLLGLDADKAEVTTAKMIEQGRLRGKIDQLDGRIAFEDEGEMNGASAIRQWDSNVLGVAEEVENVVAFMQQEIPAFVSQNLMV